MTSLPSLLTRERIVDVSLVIASSVGQAVAAAVAAFATRDAFAALHSANGIPVNTLVRLGMAGVLGAVCLYFAQRHSESLGQSYANALRLCFYRQIAGLPKSRHQERRLGALSLRFIGDLSAARLWFGQGLPDVATAFIVLPATVLIFMALDLSLALAGIVPIGISLILIAGLGWHLEYRHRALRTRRSGLAIDMVERIAISPELDLMGRTNREIRALEERGVHLRKDAVARRARTASLQSILQAGAAVSGLLMMWTASKMTITPAVVAACLAVLALLMVPLLSLATAWDRYCAWRVAKAKALRLLSEATIDRAIKRRNMAVQVEMSGRINGLPVAFSFKRAAVTQLKSEHASSVARHIAGLDRSKGCVIHFDRSADQPKTAYIGDVHVGIQGSLRRCATLLCPKRPKDESILATLLAYDLAHLLISDKGLDARIAEGGRNLSTLDTLRLDLVRAELAEVDLLVMDSVRWRSLSEETAILDVFLKRASATTIISCPKPDAVNAA